MGPFGCLSSQAKPSLVPFTSDAVNDRIGWHPIVANERTGGREEVVAALGRDARRIARGFERHDLATLTSVIGERSTLGARRWP